MSLLLAANFASFNSPSYPGKWSLKSMLKPFSPAFSFCFMSLPIKDESSPPDRNSPTSTSLTFLYSTDSFNNLSIFSIASSSEISLLTSILNGSQY